MYVLTSLTAVLVAMTVLQPPPTAPVQGDDLVQPYDSEHADGHPLPSNEAAARFRMPPGFHVSVFAAEPDVRNPIAMTWDAKGRLWVAENDTYAERELQFDLSLRDRVTIFDDSDGDGQFDQRHQFTDDARRLTGLEVGRGGVWLACPPQIPLRPRPRPG